MSKLEEIKERLINDELERDDYEWLFDKVEYLQKVLEVQVKKEILSYHVIINDICVTTFKEQWKAEEFVEGLKNLNPYRKIKRII